MGTPFVSIHNARWEIHLDDAIIHTFPESGAGLMEFFRLHEIREVMCSSSVDFPEEESALNAKQASEILQAALAWKNDDNSELLRLIRRAYGDLHSANHITDEQIDLLLKVIGDAMPFLQAAPAFSLVCREARMNQEALEGYKRFRQARGGFQLHSHPVPTSSPKEIGRSMVHQSTTKIKS